MSSSLAGTMNGEINLGPEEGGGEELSLKDVKKVEKEIQRLENQHQPPQHQKRTLKGTSTAVRLAQRLSPKSHRKLMTEESLIKVNLEASGRSNSYYIKIKHAHPSEQIPHNT